MRLVIQYLINHTQLLLELEEGEHRLEIRTLIQEQVVFLDLDH
jgi:hypothetical protein